MKYTPHESFKQHLPRFRRSFRLDPDEHSEIYTQMRSDPAYRHETDEELRHRAAYKMLWKKHGKKPKKQGTSLLRDTATLIAIIGLLVIGIIFLTLEAHGQVDGIQIQQGGVSKGQVSGGIAKLNFSGCTVSTKASNTWIVSCAGGPGGGPGTDAGAANNFFSSYNADTGTFGKARPTCSTLSDSGTLCSSSATIPAAQVNADWNAGSGAAQILNKPAIPGAVPSGAIIFLKTGTCPTGYTEETTLDGYYLLATKAADGDVGTAAAASLSLTAAAQGFTGDSTTVPAETVNSLSAAAQAISGSTAAEASHTHGVTSNVTGTITPGGSIAWPANPPTNGAIAIGTFVNVATATSGNCAATNIAQGTSTTNACKATAPNLTVPAEGHSGSLTPPVISYPANVPVWTGTASQAVTMTNNAVTSGAGSSHLHAFGTLANAASAVTGTLNSTSITPLGHNATSAVTGTATPASFKLIPCSKN